MFDDDDLASLFSEREQRKASADLAGLLVDALFEAGIVPKEKLAEAKAVAGERVYVHFAMMMKNLSPEN